MIAGIINEQRTGKGIVGVGLLLLLMAEYGYSPYEACGNATVLVQGYRKFVNTQMREVLHSMSHEHIKGKLFYLAEADIALPPRYWHRPENTDTLIGLQQEQKLCNWLIWDAHFHGVDNMLEDATQVFIIPKYIPALDIVKLEWWRNHSVTEEPYHGAFYNVSKWIFPYYLHEEPVD